MGRWLDALRTSSHRLQADSHGNALLRATRAMYSYPTGRNCSVATRCRQRALLCRRICCHRYRWKPHQCVGDLHHEVDSWRCRQCLQRPNGQQAWLRTSLVVVTCISPARPAVLGANSNSVAMRKRKIRCSETAVLTGLCMQANRIAIITGVCVGGLAVVLIAVALGSRRSVRTDAYAYSVPGDIGTGTTAVLSLIHI